jgi:hypothetical protein
VRASSIEDVKLDFIPDSQPSTATFEAGKLAELLAGVDRVVPCCYARTGLAVTASWITYIAIEGRLRGAFRRVEKIIEIVGRAGRAGIAGIASDSCD